MVSDKSLVKKRFGLEKRLELCSGLRPEYSFGDWTRDIQNWVRVAELHVQQQASASVSSCGWDFDWDRGWDWDWDWDWGLDFDCDWDCGCDWD